MPDKKLLPLNFLFANHYTYGVKVPTVTAFFWVIKVLCTTVGETFADFLTAQFEQQYISTYGIDAFNAQNVSPGLTKSAWVFTIIAGFFMIVQFSLNQYFPPIYWICVVLISIVGTLYTDTLHDGLQIENILITPWAALVLALCFSSWYYWEKTLSIHSIYTFRREVFYWLVILFTFTLGTAAGDLIGETTGLGFGNSACVFSGIITFVGLLWAAEFINPVLGFWVVYILTRPLGASLGDLLSQDPANNAVYNGPYTSLDHWFYGANIGTTATSIIFLSLILIVTIYLAVTRSDALSVEEVMHEDDKEKKDVEVNYINPSAAAGDIELPTQPVAFVPTHGVHA